jgi:hypothetical protein
MLLPRSERATKAGLEQGRPGQPVTELEVLALLGWPDFYDSGPAGAQLAYRYKVKPGVLEMSPQGVSTHLFDRQESNWLAYVDIDGRGFAQSIGFNEERAHGTAGLLPYVAPWPATRPARAAAPGAPRGFVGVGVENVRWSVDGHTYEGTRGARVVKVAEGSPAQRAGLRVGDIIDQIDGVPISVPSFFAEIAKRRPGRTIRLTVFRGGAADQAQELSITVEARPAAATQRASGGRDDR